MMLHQHQTVQVKPLAPCNWYQDSSVTLINDILLLSSSRNVSGAFELWAEAWLSKIIFDTFLWQCKLFDFYPQKWSNLFSVMERRSWKLPSQLYIYLWDGMFLFAGSWTKIFEIQLHLQLIIIPSMDLLMWY